MLLDLKRDNLERLSMFVLLTGLLLAELERLLGRVGKRRRLVGGATSISILPHPLIPHQHAREAWIRIRISSSKMILLVLVCGSV